MDWIMKQIRIPCGELSAIHSAAILGSTVLLVKLVFPKVPCYRCIYCCEKIMDDVTAIKMMSHINHNFVIKWALEPKEW